MARKRIGAWECANCAAVVFEWGRARPRSCRKCGCTEHVLHNARKERDMEVVTVVLDQWPDGHWTATVTLAGCGVIGRADAWSVGETMDAAKRIVAGVVLTPALRRG